VYLKKPGSIGGVKGLQEAGKDMCREKAARGLHRKPGWGQAAEATRYGSGADPRIDPVPDTGMVQAGVEVG
jgi:hypothetical protein